MNEPPQNKPEVAVGDGHPVPVALATGMLFGAGEAAGYLGSGSPGGLHGVLFASAFAALVALPLVVLLSGARLLLRRFELYRAAAAKLDALTSRDPAGDRDAVVRFHSWATGIIVGALAAYLASVQLVGLLRRLQVSTFAMDFPPGCTRCAHYG